VTQPFDSLRICCVGAESTGKTTLVRALAERHGAPSVPEYGRDYTVEKKAAGTNDHWTTVDFIAIAVEQQRMEDAAAVGEVLYCDTDAMSTDLWHERYLGARSAAVEAIARMRTYDLFVLCDIDIPWEADEIRLGADSRTTMHHRFLEVIAAERPEPMMVASGGLELRMDRVDEEVERLGLRRPGYEPARCRTADGFRFFGAR
jgi:HTH-type transcriptional regulator, transcriptional repressor of NAD biosynthesis genes